MTKPIQYETLTALQARKLIDEGALTATGLLEACLERIGHRESDVHAWAYLDRALARAQAAELDRHPGRGLLHGIPFGIKDIIDTFDMPSRYGSPIYADHQPAWDAGAVALARAAGGLALGKTVTTEFANRHPGPTRNPHNLAHTPGGSSSGSAAAVADFHVLLAIGTQTGGSVIRPAAYCGVYGYKPTFQTVPNAGVRTNTDAFDTVGMMARSIGDLALFRAALSAIPYVAVEATPIRSLRFGVCRTPWWESAQAESRDAVTQTVEHLSTRGAGIVAFDLPAMFADAESAHRLICAFEIVRNYADELAHSRDQLSEDFRRIRVEPGQGASLAEFRSAHRCIERCRLWFAQALAEHEIDALITPSAPGEAPAGIASSGNPIFNFLWTALYAPAITLPRFSGPHGLPVGVQLVGAPFQDHRLFQLAMAVDDLLINRGAA